MWSVTLDEPRKRRLEIERIAESHGPQGAVSSSVARGEALSGSDVDSLVDFDPERTVIDRSALSIDLQALGWEIVTDHLPALPTTVEEELRGQHGCALSVGPIRASLGTAVGTRWEQIASSRGLSCPLMSPREVLMCREFRVGTGVATA